MDGFHRTCMLGLLILASVAACGPVHQPNPVSTAAETRWLLIRNPSFGDVRGEPEYVWVEEDRVPTTIQTLMNGKRSIMAPPEVVARYGPPPAGGRIRGQIGPRQFLTCRPRGVWECRCADRAGRPDRIPIVHPVTGEVLGELDEPACCCGSGE
jgi:hypothetical protein